LVRGEQQYSWKAAVRSNMWATGGKRSKSRPDHVGTFSSRGENVLGQTGASSKLSAEKGEGM